MILRHKVKASDYLNGAHVPPPTENRALAEKGKNVTFISRVGREQSSDTRVYQHKPVSQTGYSTESRTVTRCRHVV